MAQEDNQRRLLDDFEARRITAEFEGRCRNLHSNGRGHEAVVALAMTLQDVLACDTENEYPESSAVENIMRSVIHILSGKKDDRHYILDKLNSGLGFFGMEVVDHGTAIELARHRRS